MCLTDAVALHSQYCSVNLNFKGKMRGSVNYLVIWRVPDAMKRRAEAGVSEERGSDQGENARVSLWALSDNHCSWKISVPWHNSSKLLMKSFLRETHPHLYFQ